MRINIFKKIKLITSYHEINKKKGFALLFAILLSTIILVIALSVSNIALKELNFSTSAVDTNNAFFAADTGAECALYNDRYDVNKFPLTGSTGQIKCNNKNISLSSSPGSNSVIYSFIITDLGSSNDSCAKVTINKKGTPMTTQVSSKGYNLGGSSGCSSTSSRLIERELIVNY